MDKLDFVLAFKTAMISPINCLICQQTFGGRAVLLQQFDVIPVSSAQTAVTT